jgi:hypothetical protein
MQNSVLDARLEALTGEVELLKKRLARMEMKLASSCSSSPGARADSESISPAFQAEPVAAENDPADDVWTWLGKASLLPKIAAVSFVLVVALLLRTLTDTNVIAQQTGSYAGLGYAALLLGLGWRLLARQRPLAPILLACGAMLTFLITLEAHGRFAALSSLAAYIILLATLAVLVALASRHNSPFLGTLGLLGAGMAGFFIDFPNPVFPLAALFLLLTNCTAYLVSNRTSRGETGRWGLFLLTAIFWVNWMMKLDSTGHELAWFVSFLILHQGAYSIMILHRTFGLGRLSVLDTLLPTIGGLLFYLAARAAIMPWLDQPALIGAAGLGWSALLFLAAFLAVHRSKASGTAACVFTFAGSAILLLTVPDITASILLSLPIWAMGALFLARLSSHCEVGGIRLASYLLQVTACAAGIASGSFAVLSGHLALSLAVAGGLTVLSGYHYWTSRQNPLNCSAGFFARIDPRDRTAMVLLLAAVANGFYAMQLGAALALAGMSIALEPNMTGLQSVFLNGGAFLLMVLGLRSRNRELLAVALAVFIAGAGKVFGYDLFVIKGIPLMLSVFSFGVAAALASVILSRWQRAGLA